MEPMLLSRKRGCSTLGVELTPKGEPVYGVQPAGRHGRHRADGIPSD